MGVIHSVALEGQVPSSSPLLKSMRCSRRYIETLWVNSALAGETIFYSALSRWIGANTVSS
jgi:hypothetical protein